MQKHNANGFEIAPIGFIGKPETDCGPRHYRLAKDGLFAVYQFGPLFTLRKAETYAEEIRQAGFPVLVVNAFEGVAV